MKNETQKETLNRPSLMRSIKECEEVILFIQYEIDELDEDCDLFDILDLEDEIETEREKIAGYLLEIKKIKESKL